MVAHPDYKRPWTSTSVYHYKTLEQAHEKRKEEKRDYYESYMENLKDQGEDVPENIDDLDEDEAQNYIYYDSYLDMLPFSEAIYHIQVEDDAIITKKVF